MVMPMKNLARKKKQSLVFLLLIFLISPFHIGCSYFSRTSSKSEVKKAKIDRDRLSKELINAPRIFSIGSSAILTYNKEKDLVIPIEGMGLDNSEDFRIDVSVNGVQPISEGQITISSESFVDHSSVVNNDSIDVLRVKISHSYLKETETGDIIEVSVHIQQLNALRQIIKLLESEHQDIKKNLSKTKKIESLIGYLNADFNKKLLEIEQEELRLYPKESDFEKRIKTKTFLNLKSDFIKELYGISESQDREQSIHLRQSQDYYKATAIWYKWLSRIDNSQISPELFSKYLNPPETNDSLLFQLFRLMELYTAISEKEDLLQRELEKLEYKKIALTEIESEGAARKKEIEKNIRLFEEKKQKVSIDRLDELDKIRDQIDATKNDKKRKVLINQWRGTYNKYEKLSEEYEKDIDKFLTERHDLISDIEDKK